MPSYTEQLNDRGYYAELKQLIQTMYVQNNNTRVTFVVHSMGGPVSLYFLTRIVSQEWKDTYIHSYIPLAGAWSGGNGVVTNLLTGPLTNSSIDRVIGVQKSRNIYRTYPSFYFLLPRASVLNNTVLITTTSRNYTANDYQQLFTDAGYPQGYTQLSEIDVEWPAPNVPTYCFYGLGVPTPASFVYANGLDMLPTDIGFGDGDGTVNRPSLEVCLRWANSSYRFQSTVFQGVGHSAILSDVVVLQSIKSVVDIPDENPTSSAVLLAPLHFIHYGVIMTAISFQFYSCR